jgi:PAS domain S-box-containing protein
MHTKRHSTSFYAARILPLVAGAVGIGVFLVDTFTTLDIAVAVLYVVVVLVASNFLGRRGVILVAMLCVALTVFGYLVSHGLSADTALLRCLVSILAIWIATLLALRNQATTAALVGQARLLDLTHDAIFVRDMNDVVSYWNRGAEELYGWAAQEAVGKSAHRLLQTRFPEPVETISAKIVETGRWEGELEHTRRDGTKVTVASRWSLQQDARGQPAAVLESNTDITEQKRAEQEIRRAERNLQATIDTIPAIVASYLPDGTRDFANRTWQAYAGLSGNDAKVTGWASLIHPDDFEAARREWADSLARGQPFQMELRFRRADGEYRWHLVRRVPLRDEQGKVIKWYSVGFDIEEQKRAEAALRRSEAHSVEAQRLSQTGSFGWRINDGKTTWSKETYRILGYDQTVKPSLDLVLARVHPDDLKMVQHQLDSAEQGGREFDFEHRLLMPDGQIKDLHVRARRVAFGSGVAEIVGAVMDISEAKRAQEALQTAQAELAHMTRVTTLGELTASIAHEVNQPLAGIVTNGEAGLRWLAKEVPGIEEARQAMERMIRDAERAAGVVRRIRALAKKAAPEMARLDINDVISDAMLLVRREMLSHRVPLKLELAPELPPVPGDRVQLQQVIINLMLNGIEAMAETAEEQRRLVVRSQLNEEGQVLVAVQDAGTGIDPENANRLFSAFYTTKANGMGMGLSICRSIVKAHHGRIWATNNEGPGATIQFTIPVARDEDAKFISFNGSPGSSP